MNEPDHKRDNLNSSTIKEYLVYLNKYLPQNPTAKKTPFQLPYEIKDNFIYKDDLVIHLQNIAEHIGYYLLIIKKVLVIYYDIPINGEIKIFTCDPNGSVFIHENYSDAAGHYSKIDSNLHIITIHKKRGYKMKHLIGILVHEMMHHYLTIMNIRKYNTTENEIMTDLACCYLGFGHLLLEAYSAIEWTSNHWERNNQSGHTLHRTWIGYITTEDLREAISFSTQIREIKPREILKSIISTSDRSIISAKLLQYRIKLVITSYKNIVKVKYQSIFLKKNFTYMEKCDNLLKLNFQLIQNLEVLAKTDLIKINMRKSRYDNEIVNIVNSLAVGKFERELLEIKLILNTKIFKGSLIKKLQDIENQINKIRKLLHEVNII